MKKKDVMFYDKCPLESCKATLEDTGDGIHFYCSQCGNTWFLDDLEIIPLQKSLDDFTK